MKTNGTEIRKRKKEILNTIWKVIERKCKNEAKRKRNRSSSLEKKKGNINFLLSFFGSSRILQESWWYSMHSQLSSWLFSPLLRIGQLPCLASSRMASVFKARQNKQSTLKFSRDFCKYQETGIKEWNVDEIHKRGRWDWPTCKLTFSLLSPVITDSLCCYSLMLYWWRKPVPSTIKELILPQLSSYQYFCLYCSYIERRRVKVVQTL